jgi:hypothetical protein
MKPPKTADHVAEVLRLGLIEGTSVRQIAKRLSIARKTVRKILGLHSAPPVKAAAARGSLLDAYETPLRAILDDVPDILAPAVLERLRPLGYAGGVTILRARLRQLRAGRSKSVRTARDRVLDVEAEASQDRRRGCSVSSEPAALAGAAEAER